MTQLRPFHRCFLVSGPPTECFVFHARATETILPCRDEVCLPLCFHHGINCSIADLSHSFDRVHDSFWFYLDLSDGCGFVFRMGKEGE